MTEPKTTGAVAIPNGKNPLIERLAGAAAKLGVNRAKMNFGYIALLGTFSGALVVIVFGCVNKDRELIDAGLRLVERVGLPVIMAVVVGNVATKVRSGGTNGNES